VRDQHLLPSLQAAVHLHFQLFLLLAAAAAAIIWPPARSAADQAVQEAAVAAVRWRHLHPAGLELAAKVLLVGLARAQPLMGLAAVAGLVQLARMEQLH
jgi:hypothetical protein